MFFFKLHAVRERILDALSGRRVADVFNVLAEFRAVVIARRHRHQPKAVPLGEETFRRRVLFTGILPIACS